MTNVQGPTLPKFRKVLANFGAGLLLAAVGGPAFAGDLTGRVSDASGTHSLAGAEISIPGANRFAVTGQNGEFRIPGLPAGTYPVTVRYVGAEDLQQTVTVDASGTARMDARMKSAGPEEIIVVGQRAQQNNALSLQRSADTTSSFLTRDGIGQFPDQNVSEAVRRVPGVSVQNDQGEGRFIVLRGIDPNLNAASLNGTRVVAPESDIRAVALDVVAAELIESIEVQKSLTPEMDGDAIGGAIDIRTTSAFDRKGPYVSLTGSGSYNQLMDEFSPKIGLDASNTFNDRLGVSVGFSWFDRQLGSENVEAEDWTEDGGVAWAESLELRDYDIERTRIGGTLGLDFIATENTTLFARLVYNSFEDQEYRSALALDFGDAAPVAGDLTQATFDLGPDEEIGASRELKDRNEKQIIGSYVVGGETFVDLWTFNYSGSFTHAEEDESDTFDPTSFERDFEEGELRITQFNLDRNIPRIEIDPASNALFTDPAEYEFDSTERVDGLAEDDEFSARLDIARNLALEGADAEVKFGGKARWREKKYGLTVDIFDGFDGAGDFLLSDVAQEVDYDLNPLNPVPDSDPVRDFLGDLSDFERNAAESEFESAAADFKVDEDIYAAYAQGRYESGPLRLVGGVRMEHTSDDVRGNRVDFVEEGGTFDGVTVTEDTTFVQPVEFDNDYTHWLPSVNARFEANDQLIVRAAAYRSVVRPNMADLAPRFLVEQADDDEREGEFGNPDLKPYRAWNFDAGVEWYFSDNGVLQGGVFYKDIKDFIFHSVFEDFDFNGVFVDEGVIPLNGDSADVLGFELNYQHALTMLPSPFDGVLIGVNYTRVDSDAKVDGRKIPLPATSDNVLNVALGYEKGPLSLRLAGVYRDEYLDELSDDGESDRYVDEHFSLDFSAKYRIMEKVQIFFEAVNLTNEPFVAVSRTPDLGDRTLQYEEYERTFNAGLRFTY